MQHGARDWICHTSCEDLLDTWAKWNIWAEKELKHVMADVKHTVAYNVTLIAYGVDVWEDAQIFIYSDSNFASLHSDGGRLIVLAG